VVANNDTDGTSTGVVELVGAVEAVEATFGVEVGRTHICLFSTAHWPVNGQRNTPVSPFAHTKDTVFAGTERNDRAQPDDDAIDTTRVLFNRANNEGFQHNSGAGFAADQDCAPPTQLSRGVTRLTTPDDASTHTDTELGKRPASATPPAHKAPATKTTAIPKRPNLFTTKSCPEIATRGRQTKM